MDEWDEQSRWDVYKQALDAVVANLAAPLSVAQFVNAAQCIADGSRRSKRKRKRQMKKLREIGAF